jgi:Reverse transcriptase (RNA-dependent DNA polymerase)
MLPSTLNWFASFLHGRTQRVIISHSTSATCDVTSGVPQGSVLSPTLFCIYIDTLLQSITELTGNDNIKIFAYADDLKIVTETSTNHCRMAQQVVDLVRHWSITHKMPLSVEKSGVLHCGTNNPTRPYYLDGQNLPVLQHFKDLGVWKSPSASYSHHINSLIPACNRLCGSIQKAFRSRDPDMLWSAFQTYIKPKIMYAAPVWNPLLKVDIVALERVQRRFTKKFAGLNNLSYDQRLSALNALTLEQERLLADVSTLHRCIYGKSDCPLSSIGVTVSCNNKRSGKVRLEQSQHTLRTSNSLFSHRAVREWNSLPSNITSISSISSFKSKLRAHLLSV